MATRYEAQRRRAEYYLTVLGTADKLYQAGREAFERALMLVKCEWSNIQSGREWAETQSGTDDVAASLCSRYQQSGAYVFSLIKHPQERIGWLRIALSSARRLGNRAAEAAHLNDLGIAYDEVGETQLAISFYEQRIAIARELGDFHGQAKSLGNMGVSYKNLGDAQRAIECFEHQLSVSRRIKDLRGEANALGGLGIVHARLQDTQRAIDYQRQSLRLHRELGDRRGEGNATGNLGGAYFLAGDLKRANALYNERLDIARQLEDRHGEANALWGLSLVSDENGNRAKALEYGQAAVEIFDEIESPSADEMRSQLKQWQS